jgi:hypothetical protein
VRHPQALGREKFQLAAEALASMAQVRALVRKLVLEELLSGEVLEVWIIDPAFARAFVGQNMLEQKSPITNCVAIPSRPLSLYSGAIPPSMKSQSILPASCTGSCRMLMIWSSPRAEQITRSCRRVLLRPHRGRLICYESIQGRGLGAA